MASNVNVNDLLNRAKMLNKKVSENNENNRRQEGAREATMKQLKALVDKYNKEYGADLSLDDVKTIEAEYRNELKTIHTSSNHLSEVLDAVDKGDSGKLTQLTGFDITQDRISVPDMYVDIEELEKEANTAYEQVVNNAIVSEVAELSDNTSNAFFGANFNVEEEDDNSSENVESEGSIEGNSETTGFSFNLTDEEDANKEEEAPNFFSGNKVSSDSEAGKEESQTEANTVPDFSSMFSSEPTNNQESSTKKETKDEDEAPSFDFGSLSFGNEDNDTSNNAEKKEESSSIGGFLSNFNQQNEEAKKDDSKPNEDAIQKALAEQQKVMENVKKNSLDGLNFNVDIDD